MPSYVAPNYDELYKKYYGNTDTSFYKNAVDQYREQQEKNRTMQIGEAQKTQQSALKQAYITRLQNEQRLNQNLATQGIRGGMTETSNLRLANQYGADRSNANTNYANSVNSINQNIDQNIRDYQSDMESRAEEYRQNQANAMVQARREDSLNEFNSAAEYWSNYYLDYYSGVKKSKLKSALKTAKKNRDNAKTPEEKLKYEMQIRGIQNRRGVIANK